MQENIEKIILFQTKKKEIANRIRIGGLVTIYRLLTLQKNVFEKTRVKVSLVYFIIHTLTGVSNL